MKKFYWQLMLTGFGFSVLGYFLLLAGIESTFPAFLIALIAGGLLFGILKARSLRASDFPLFTLPLAYTALLWAVCMMVSFGYVGHMSWVVYSFLHFPFIPAFFISNIEGESRIFLWAPLSFELAFFVPVMVKILFQKKGFLIPRKNSIIVLSIILLAFASGGAVQWQRSKSVLPSYGFAYGGGYSSTDLRLYEVSNPDNKLPKLKNRSDFTINNPKQMPVLDGAEAAFPVYSAFANAVYENIKDVSKQKDIVSFSNTIYAYERLLSEDVDIYFGAEPSVKQREMAKKAGKELVMTPIGKEAFVFFVNQHNPIDSLSVSDIKGIYSGGIKNWAQLGGKSDRIVAFQRPEDSGSQTLLEKIMADQPIIKPMKEEVPAGMGGIIEQVADYRNFENAIGFSFRFFATGMRDSSNIKLLAINGVKPDPENISSRSYPFTASLYAITLKSNKNKTITPFLNWMKGPQGQKLVEDVGYIKKG
ncbi:PstS family phosphate ABC transporter substrate-binding protein [Metabacillus sp. RGM 3146]|uniref:PstS family phosphate ABC transporter substrate-binding protein n=1 Tax=Metabacillus sp. RGM 3146 TaxID=3401092 RepID=UPI003B9CC2C7